MEINGKWVFYLSCFLFCFSFQERFLYSNIREWTRGHHQAGKYRTLNYRFYFNEFAVWDICFEKKINKNILLGLLFLAFLFVFFFFYNDQSIFFVCSISSMLVRSSVVDERHFVRNNNIAVLAIFIEISINVIIFVVFAIFFFQVKMILRFIWLCDSDKDDTDFLFFFLHKVKFILVSCLRDLN